MTDQKKPPPQLEFEKDEECVSLYQGKTAYLVKIAKIKHRNNYTHYTISYPGWGDQHDEVICSTETEGRLFKMTMAEFREKFPNAEIGADKAYFQTARRRSVVPKSKKGGERKKPDSEYYSDKKPVKRWPKFKLAKPLTEILIEDRKMVKSGVLARLPAVVTIEKIVEEYHEFVDRQVEDAELSGQLDDAMTSTVLTPMEVEIRKLAANAFKDYINGSLRTHLLYSEEWDQYDKHQLEILGPDHGMEVEWEEFTEEELAENAEKEKLAKEEREEATGIKEDDTPKYEKKLKRFIAKKKYEPAKYYGFSHLLRLVCNFHTLLLTAKYEKGPQQIILSGINPFIEYITKNWAKFHKKLTNAGGPRRSRNAK
ncbi:hypothetical protein L5515_010154 [Caenorhabditis briggsae]|uniref:MRG domain-containing protein n=2 Tax=Caenorhabditis briggsae TaxID=6238 RepID=A0AAE9JCU1_CAEBR|nr:hypothetical protein L5515_010154 [Caenorhabditis briggsae]